MKQIILAFLFLAVTRMPALADHELFGRDIASGKSLYAEQCAACHGTNLEGQPDWMKPNSDGILPAPPHDETGHTWHHDNALLFSYTKLGGDAALKKLGVENFKSGMPGFSEILTDEEIWNILAFIRSTWSKRVQEFQAERNSKH